MKFLGLSLVMAFTLAAAPPVPRPTAAPAPSGPGAAIMATINGVVNAVNANDANRVGSYFGLDATIVDEIAPYTWTGSDAGTLWWQSVQHQVASLGATNIHATAGTIAYWEVTGDHAYVIVPLTITVTGGHARPMSETGLWTMTLSQSGASWLIETATWSTQTKS